MRMRISLRLAPVFEKIMSYKITYSVCDQLLSETTLKEHKRLYFHDDNNSEHRRWVVPLLQFVYPHLAAVRIMRDPHLNPWV